MKKRGFTIIELVVVIGMSLLILYSLTFAYSQMLRYEETMPERLQRFQVEVKSEKLMKEIFSEAFLSRRQDDTYTYFIANPGEAQSNTAISIAFTTTALTPTKSFLANTEDQTFDELNERYGPQGGLSEVSFSVTPIGDAGGQVGLFLRIQNPPDGDPTQGGYERLIIPDVESVNFVFWDGTDWITTWDTSTQARRLPAAVKMYYTIPGDQFEHESTFQLINSDITIDDPLTIEGGG